MARTPDPEPGQRIRVTKAADGDAALLQPGSTGTIAEVYDHAVAVEWDDAYLNDRDVALLRGADRWEVLPDAPPPHP